jgi:inner membrane protein
MSIMKSSGARALESPGAKAILVGLLVVAFLLPLFFVREIVDERRSSRDRAEASIIAPAGGKPGLFGPFVVVPYSMRRDKETIEGEIVILPDELSLKCVLTSEERTRGIFSAPILHASVELSGRLSADCGSAAPQGARLDWGAARVAFELPDLRSLAETPELVWNGAKLALRPDATNGLGYARGVSCAASLSSGGNQSFSARLELRGGRSLSFLEPAGTVRASVEGDWASPSFFGYAAPTERKVAKEGFSASWYLPESSQGLPRVFDSGDMPRDKLLESAFGVELLDSVDAYSMSWRAARYGLLFIIVPFAVLFLFELLARTRIHPVQYVLIGLANCLFYLLLLSLSELIGFDLAYVAAALVCSSLCAAYTTASLRSRRGFYLWPALALLYGYLYVALSSEDYALLIGSLGLLGLLAAAMAATRKIDWYGKSAPPGAVSTKAAPDDAAPIAGEDEAQP